MRPVFVFFGLAYLISWLIWLPLYGHIFNFPALPILPYHHAIGGLGPLIASFLTTWIFYKTEGIHRLLKRSFQIHPLKYSLIALFSPFVLLLIACLMSYFIDNQRVNLSHLFYSKEFPEFNLLTFFAYNLIFFGWGEEVGWRGFALPYFQSRWNALTASLLLTIFWALWHLPLFFYRPGYTSMDLGGIVGWVFSLLTGSILLTWMYNSAKASILTCAIFHSTIDVAFTADISNPQIINYLGFLITFWGILIIIIFKPQNLSVQPREKYE